jgi:Uma2 family endonuclease
MSALLDAPSESLADVLEKLGGISPQRIGLPVGTATEQDVIRAMDAADKRLYELVDGILVEKVMGMKESRIASEIVRHLGNYLEDFDRGFTFCPDGPIRIRSGRIRFPDTGFVSWDRIPDEEVLEEPILNVAPNLAIEVISEGNTPREMEQKLKDYFKAGVQLVWYIYPKTQTAVAYTSPTAKKTIDKNGTLDGAKVLPGFLLPLKKLFGRTKRRANGK